jgi:hypothetical protein
MLLLLRVHVLPSSAGYLQIMSYHALEGIQIVVVLCIYAPYLFQGYRVISIDVPQVWNHHEWIHSFEKFLDSMNIHHVRNITLFSLCVCILIMLLLTSDSHFLFFATLD